MVQKKRSAESELKNTDGVQVSFSGNDVNENRKKKIN